MAQSDDELDTLSKPAPSPLQGRFERFQGASSGSKSHPIPSKGPQSSSARSKLLLQPSTSKSTQIQADQSRSNEDPSSSALPTLESRITDTPTTSRHAHFASTLHETPSHHTPSLQARLFDHPIPSSTVPASDDIGNTVQRLLDIVDEYRKDKLSIKGAFQQFKLVTNDATVIKDYMDQLLQIQRDP